MLPMSGYCRVRKCLCDVYAQPDMIPSANSEHTQSAASNGLENSTYLHARMGHTEEMGGPYIILISDNKHLAGLSGEY